MENVQKERSAAAPALARAGGLVVAVVGSRSLTSCRALLRRLDALHAAGEVAEVVSGAATGVDTLAATWACANGVPCTEHRPDYRAHGACAPLVRNGAIVATADLVLICWDGASRGTLDAARKAAKLGRRCEWLVVAAPSAAPVPGGLGL